MQAHRSRPARAPADSPPTRARRPARLNLWVAAACLLASAPAAAVDFGPFSLTGFAKAEVTRTTNVCIDCQKEPLENRQRFWADDLVYGKRFGTDTSQVWLFQPYLGAKFDLPQGFRLTGLLSQRIRDGKVDIPGFLYEKNVALQHEEYGRLAVGAMTSRAWSLADYPTGTVYGLSDAWASGGAGYALLNHAIRYTYRPLDVFEGDLVLEATYDSGTRGWERNKPHFLEIYAQYVRGDLVAEMMYQVSRNGEPVSWGHAPFSGLTFNPDDDDKLGSSGQSILMFMARHPITSSLEMTGGIRFNYWSGAYAVPTTFGRNGQWNNMFNVDWGGFDANGVPNPGYSARTIDLMLGARYRINQRMAFTTGLVYLGEGSTDNPSERGQSNSATINNFGLNYDVAPGFSVYALAGMVHYKRKGLAPLSMPSHNAFTGVDPRVATRAHWFGLGAVYTF